MALETVKISSLPTISEPSGSWIVGEKEGITGKVSVDALRMDGTAYGVRIDSAVSNSALTRIGNPVLHQSLPIQSKMRRCILKTDGTVNYYLDANNSNLKENGTAANLTGADGDIMVEIPEYFFRVDVVSATANELWISLSQLPGFQKMPKMYISAEEATVDRTALKLASVVNNTANYRGGNNNAAWDLESRTLLGRPATLLSRINFTTYARNKGAYGINGAGWNQFTYDAWKAMCMLYFVEYANLNSQLPFNSLPDANGFRQGGLGEGVTTLVGAKNSAFNSYYPFVPCGHTASLGNKTGVTNYTMPVEYDPVSTTVQVNSYRGIAMPFGHSYKWIEGINIRVQANDSGGRSTAFTTSNPVLFNPTNYTGYREIGDTSRADQYIKEMMLGAQFDLIGKVGAGGSTTYWCDMGYFSALPATGEALRALFVGGNSYAGAAAGLVFSHSRDAPSASYANFGARLVFHP